MGHVHMCLAITIAMAQHAEAMPARHLWTTARMEVVSRSLQAQHNTTDAELGTWQ